MFSIVFVIFILFVFLIKFRGINQQPRLAAKR